MSKTFTLPRMLAVSTARPNANGTPKLPFALGYRFCSLATLVTVALSYHVRWFLAVSTAQPNANGAS